MKERLRNILDTEKKHKGIVALCLLIAAVCITGGWFTVNYMNSVNDQKVHTIKQIIGLDLNSIDRIDAVDGDIPEKKITNRADIQALLEPFLSSQVKKVSSQKANELSKFSKRDGATGFCYVLCKKGQPYMQMDIFKDKNVIVFNKYNTLNHRYGNSVYYDFVTPIDTNAISRLDAKYSLNTY